ncbi:hypothetical protein ABZY03_12285 [Streptomyces klenkii]|uniref:hypothetical protein n=1 Tax=Streptomyces klenkii TaxID=1420899 RepID=UPI0033A6052A
MRRKTIVSASASAAAAALALGAVLAGCGGTDRDAYVASEAAGPGSSSHPVGGAVPPDQGVELHSLPAAPPGRASGSPGPGRSRPPASAPSAPSSPDAPPSPPSSAGPHDGGAPSSGHGTDPRTGARSPSPPSRTGPARPSAPAATPSSPGKPSQPPQPSRPPGDGGRPPAPARLDAGTPRRSADDEARRWCEKVTVPLTNSGGSPVTTGTVTFGTHVIDLLGIDWATLTSSQPLPVPIEPGAAVEATWTVCVDAWRVPWGMHVETRDVKVET